ncbi:MAG: hypothetical protein H0W40_03400 [Methylibium sp.]|uniref:hypothetical protein n=1 Tax=Methylibium sp. TaxID=2067992 RepID=UPI0017EC4DAC|nr:hypothetical protein [Methylibium sp.]MBA3596410.1 hypothetical protein [Methylibium sp.]
MEFAMSAATATPGSTGAGLASTAQHERGQRFAQLLQAEPQRENFYADASAASPSTSNPVSTFVSQFNPSEFLPDVLPDALQAESWHGAGGHEMSAVESFQMTNDRMIAFQGEILRMSLMVEMVGSAKQGVTTIFQQQG